MQTALQDTKSRKIEVNRLDLLKTLQSNLEKHKADYEEAMSGYKSQLISKIDKAFEKAMCNLNKQYDKLKAEAESLTEEKILRRTDSLCIVSPEYVEMKVPRSYANHYESAIDMVSWDVRDTLELTHAEFQCFVRDQWDWKEDFTIVSNSYKMAK